MNLLIQSIFFWKFNSQLKKCREVSYKSKDNDTRSNENDDSGISRRVKKQHLT